MNVTYSIYLFKDSHGNTAYAVAVSEKDYIEIEGLADLGGEFIYYSGQARFVQNSASLKEKGIKVQVLQKEKAFSKCWND